ncbi:hypothetical protein ACP6H7_25035 [Vibrio harveyi]|uniref:hypothetical protein n=1 Tax=Vibrio harveyi TaxID=669 RepID=UPI003CF953E0
MARLTVNLILKTISEKHGIKREYLEMVRSSDGYYFSGKFPCILSAELCTHIERLSDWDLERWVEHFDSMVEKEDFESTDYNAMVESIDWSL